MALTATITGTMIENPVGTGDTWTISYTFNDVSNSGTGLFEALGGSGTISNGIDTFDLTGKQDPYGIAFYLYDVASEFHAQWNRGKELPQLRFIDSANQVTTVARLALVYATKLVLSSGLAILGATAPEEMR